MMSQGPGVTPVHQLISFVFTPLLAPSLVNTPSIRELSDIIATKCSTMFTSYLSVAS